MVYGRFQVGHLILMMEDVWAKGVLLFVFPHLTSIKLY